MDTDIALARLASGRAVPIGAECGCGVHGGPPGFVWKQAKRSMLGPPFSLQVSFTTVKCRATTDPLRHQFTDTSFRASDYIPPFAPFTHRIALTAEVT